MPDERAEEIMRGDSEMVSASAYESTPGGGQSIDTYVTERLKSLATKSVSLGWLVAWNKCPHGLIPCEGGRE